MNILRTSGIMSTATIAAIKTFTERNYFGPSALRASHSATSIVYWIDDLERISPTGIQARGSNKLSSRLAPYDTRVAST